MTRTASLSCGYQNNLCCRRVNVSERHGDIINPAKLDIAD